MKPVLLKSPTDARRSEGSDDADLDGFLPESAAPATPAGSSRRRAVAITAGVCLLALAAGAGFMFRSRSAAAAATGSLRVESDGVNADVLIDGVARGRTPLAVTLSPGQHQLVLQAAGRTQQIGVTIESNTTTVHHIAWQPDAVGSAAVATGSLSVVTDAATAARVSIDGVDKGATPLTITDLTPGQHAVVVRDASGPRSRTVTIASGTTASLVISSGADSAASGWLKAPSDAPLQIYEDGKLVGSTESDRIMLPVGQHSFEFSNAALGFRTVRDVRITAGQTATLTVALPSAPMSVNAQPWAQVWIDGEALGETPIGNVTRTIGPHQLVFRHPQLGERTVTAVVKMNETTRVAVDMRKP